MSEVCEHQNLHIAKYATDSSLAEFPIFKECLYSLTATVLHFWLQLHFLVVAFLWMGGFYGICFLLVTYDQSKKWVLNPGFFYNTTWAKERGESLPDLEFFP